MLVAQLANATNDTIVGAGELVDLFPDVTFPDPNNPDPQWMTDNNVVFMLDSPPYNLVTQSLNQVDSYVVHLPDGSRVVYQYVVYNLTQDEIDYQLNSVLATLSLQRNQMINKSNWTQLPDSPLSDADKATWAAWRLQVRTALETYRGSDRTVLPVFDNPPQDLDNYTLLNLGPATPAPLPTAIPDTSPPAAPAPPPADPGPTPLATSAGAI